MHPVSPPLSFLNEVLVAYNRRGWCICVCGGCGGLAAEVVGGSELVRNMPPTPEVVM